MKKQHLIYPLLLTCCLLFWQQKTVPSSTKTPTKQELIDQEIQKRISDYKKSKLKKCRNAAYKRAAEVADSTLIARAKIERAQQLQRPDIPNKPDRPEKLNPKDTSAVKPLIKDEVLAPN